MPNEVLIGDCSEQMAQMPEASVDAIVTDPPYEYGFMGKSWDASGIAYSVELWQKALRVLKPGGHLMAFGGPRTFHRLTVAIEDAGFEIRDVICWLQGQGFPKSQNVQKAMAKKGYPEADAWEGWGTALKPAWEPIVVARKPLEGTVVETVRAHGTGALNIDGCRIGTEGRPKIVSGSRQSDSTYGDGLNGSKAAGSTLEGRWPANLALDETAAEMLDEQSGESKSQGGRIGKKAQSDVANVPAGQYEKGDPGYGDTGGASRFFYCAKASTSERNAGLEGFRSQEGAAINPKTRQCNVCGTKAKAPGPNGRYPNCEHDDWSLVETQARHKGELKNAHPTVKPIALMRWLVRMATPPEGVVLDPFTGSGTTGIAAQAEGFRFIGIEKEPEYAEIAKARMAHHRAEPQQASLV